MKKLVVTILIASAIPVVAPAQQLSESKVPAVVKEAFEKRYHVPKVSWEKEGVNYEANFRVNGKSMSSIIDKNGTILETETNIAPGDLPKAAQSYLKEHYAGTKVKSAAKVLNIKGEVNYEAEANGKDVVFDENGKFLKEEKD